MGGIINGLIADLNKLNKLAKEKNLPRLKAIYVLERCKIDPRKIAICAKLDFTKDNPLDKRFNLFDSSTKKNDYQTFLKVYMAYIDRNIGGDIQAEQLIGRVLRMPKAHHYESDFEELNTAYFHIKSNNNEEFKEIVKKINKELENMVPGVKNEVILASEKDKLTSCLARKTKYFPNIGTINEDLARLNIQYILENKVKDYSNSPLSVIEPHGGRTIADIKIGKSLPAIIKYEKFTSYNKLSVKTVLRKNIIRINPRALDLTDFNRKEYEKKLKFLIGVNSEADNELEIIAQDIVNAFMNTIKLITTYDNPKLVPSISLNKKKEIHEFDHSVHQYYSNLNPLELEAARGSTKMFYPDFLVWLNDDLVVAIETTGKTLLQDKIDRKLFRIEGFEREKIKGREKVIPPSKLIVGVIVTTNQKDKYQVYQVNENDKPVPVSEAMDMEGCEQKAENGFWKYDFLDSQTRKEDYFYSHGRIDYIPNLFGRLELLLDNQNQVKLFQTFEQSLEEEEILAQFEECTEQSNEKLEVNFATKRVKLTVDFLNKLHYVDKLRKGRKTPKQKAGRKRKIDGVLSALLLAHVKKDNTATQQERVNYFEKRGIRLHRSTISRTLKRSGRTQKRATKQYSELNIEKARQFTKDNYHLFSSPYCLALDEFGVNLGETSRYAYSRKGCRAVISRKG
ncbi:813_t:CDS:2 [Funneliformis geosporum]|nr:813_t:CDS:2 [Funneliformis geosporum]